MVSCIAACGVEQEGDPQDGAAAQLQPAAGRAIELEKQQPVTPDSPSDSTPPQDSADSARTAPASLAAGDDGSALPSLMVPSATAEPSATPQPSPTATPAAIRVTPTGSSHTIPGLLHTYQKWNNCGPSSVMMALSAFGLILDQLEIAAVLKPDREDTNVSPDEIAAYVEAQGLNAIVRPNGDADIARALIAAGIPVIAEQWIAVDGRGEMGHYRVLFGYDDQAGEVIAMDSYYGANRRLSYATLESEWRPFSGVYVAIYDDTQAASLASAIGGDMDAVAAWTRAAERAAELSGLNPNDAWAWFALGEASSRIGEADRSVEAFERANAIGLPVRAHWYQFGFARALQAIGGNERLIAHADATLGTMQGENLEEWQTWRGVALAALGRTEEARAAFERALFFNPNHAAAKQALEEISRAETGGG